MSISIGVAFFLLALALSAVIVPQQSEVGQSQNASSKELVPLLAARLRLKKFWPLERSGQFWFLLRSGHVSQPET